MTLWNGIELPESYFHDDDVYIIHGDCRENPLPSSGIHLLLTDPPYGLTQNKQDVVIDLSPFLAYPAVIFSQQPYTTDLIHQHKKLFKYDLIWDKVLTSGFLNANRMPLRRHEVILIFGDISYTPQKVKGNKNHGKGKPKKNANNNYGDFNFVDNTEMLGDMKHPTSIISVSKSHPSVAKHRTEKPVELLEWLVKSYSQENNIILDPFLGSGGATIACVKNNRKCIGIEISEEYCELSAIRYLRSLNDH